MLPLLASMVVACCTGSFAAVLAGALTASLPTIVMRLRSFARGLVLSSASW